MLIDTSIFVPVFRDKSGRRRERFRRLVRGVDFSLTRFTQLELLRGCGSEAQWEALFYYLDGQKYVEAVPTTWSDAARINVDLRRRGLTVGSILDCCIAQLAIEHRTVLIHNDRDFEVIAKVRPLQQRRFDIQA
jgi:predicted nucleic acid-binding protein